MNRCEVTHDRSMYDPGNGIQCDGDSLGECVECYADVCKEHASNCLRCGRLVCDDHICSRSHGEHCK